MKVFVCKLSIVKLMWVIGILLYDTNDEIFIAFIIVKIKRSDMVKSIEVDNPVACPILS